MPKIPIVGAVEPQFSGQSISAAQLPGEAAARFGGAATEIGQQMMDQQVELARTKNLMESNSQAEDAATSVYNATMQDRTIDPLKLAGTVKTGLETVHDKISKNIKDPIVKMHFDQNFEGVMDRHVTTATTVGFQRSIDDYNAQANTSMDTYVNASATAPADEVDHNKAQISGIIAGQVAHGALTKVQGQAELERRFGQIDHAQALASIQADPAGAAQLLRLNKWPTIPPVEREQLAHNADLQAARNKREDAAAVAKQRKEAIDSEATSYEADALAGNGQATFQRLSDLQKKYSTGGEPMSRETYERLYDLTAKPPQQPSDPDTLSAVKISVNSTTPMSVSALHDLYLQRKIGLNDYTEQSIVLEKNVKELADKSRVISNENRSQNEKIIADEFGGNPEIHANALKDLVAGSTLQDIEKKYQAQYKGANTNDFKTARNSFDSAVKAQQTWQRTYWGAHITDNQPLQDMVDKKRDELIVAAKKAKRILRPADPGTVEGMPWIQPDGAHVMAIAGQVIKVD